MNSNNYPEEFLDIYKIDGTVNLDLGNRGCYQSPDSYPDFQNRLKEFKNLLISLVNKKENKSFIRWGDGDYYTLTKTPTGSAGPNCSQPSISKPYEEIDHKAYLDGFIKNDYFLCEIYPNKIQMLKEIYPQIRIDYPLEYVYALVYNKWLFKEFSGKIGIIASEEKIKLIKELMKFQQYQDYLNLSKFEDYICAPEVNAGDDLEKTENILAEQLRESSSDIFLYGIGHAKLAIAHRLKKHKNAVYLDVGCATHAIAGYSDLTRPYNGNWVDHRIKDYDYDRLSHWSWDNYNHDRIIHL
tara:strand:- start:541 stop:1434 length:894 start_codon:yes stop_codon:yes gene_type:complete